MNSSHKITVYMVAALSLLCGIRAVCSDEEIDFDKQVAPILTANCLKCHNSTKARAGLNLSSRQNALKGSDAGEVLIPGKPEESLLIKRAMDGSMPPETDGRRLTPEEVKVLIAWVKAGAKWPECNKHGPDEERPQRARCFRACLGVSPRWFRRH